MRRRHFPASRARSCAKGPPGDERLLAKSREVNAAAFTAEGYFRTGDIGVFDEKGFLRIVDRKKGYDYSPSGFNVYPNEVEAAGLRPAPASPNVPERLNADTWCSLFSKLGGLSLSEAYAKAQAATATNCRALSSVGGNCKLK